MACALYFVMSCCLVLGRASVEQLQISDYNHEMLQPLTKFRQQHRRTVDGRLCAAAFVQNRRAYTGCTDAANPVGESGRPWCYVEPQVTCLEFEFLVELFAIIVTLGLASFSCRS